MSTTLSFATVDVFTHVRFGGNPLAIVNIPCPVSLSQEQKQAIAREFNYSETVFLHEDTSSPDGRKVDIFTTTEELPFAGHPTIGTLCYIGSQQSPTSSTPAPLKLLTKAGTIIATYNPSSKIASAQIPHYVRLHHYAVDSSVIAARQPSLHGLLPPKADYPLFSIVKGMTFCLIDLASLPVLSGLELSKLPLEPTCRDMLDEGWRPSMISPYYYVILHDGGTSEATRIRTRMIEQPFGEDPATGSAACALAAYLALRDGGGGGKYGFEIEQGVEMGRGSRIGVSVRLDGVGRGVERVELEGGAVVVMRGGIEVE